MAFWYKFFMSVFMLAFGSLSLSSCSRECSCMAPLTPTMIVMRGLVFHISIILYALDGGSYLVCLCVLACSGNLLWHA